jgi:hypothetical protein
MTEPNQTDSKQGTVAAVINALHPDAKGFLSVVVVFLVFFAAILGFVNMPGFIKTLFAPKDQCWEFREMQQKLWKLNKCTGEAAPNPSFKRTANGVAPWPRGRVVYIIVHAAKAPHRWRPLNSHVRPA